MPIAAQTPDLSSTETRLALLENGYWPLPIGKGKHPPLKTWQQTHADQNTARQWATDHPRCLSTGILTGEVVAVDIDALDPAIAEKLISRLLDIPDAGLAPCRTGKAPKCMFFFRAEKPQEKAATPIYHVNGLKCQVEIMGVGQQVVTHGLHDETGKPYEWTGGDLLSVPLAELPVISQDSIASYLEDATAILASFGIPEKKPTERKPAAQGGDTFWTRVNSAALAAPERWVQSLFPSAHREAGTGAWRVSSASLGRSLQEDISIHGDGIQDFGEERGTTAISLVREYGSATTPKDAAFWLCDRLGVDPVILGWQRATPQPATVRFNASKPAPVPDNDDVRDLPKPPDMHPNPYNPESAGGLLCDVAKWITSTAIIAVPELSLVAAAALVAGLFGGKALGPTSSGINIYATTIVKTAGGKGRPPKAIRALADGAGCIGTVSNGDPTSFAAFERILRKKPSTVAVLDEFGITLQSVNSKKSDAAAASIRKFLLAVYDQADGVFDGRVYASSDTKKDDSPIVGPALTVLGMTTPDTLFKGISSDSVMDGFLNRFIFVEAGDPTGEIKPPDIDANTKAPRALVAAIQKAVSDFPKPSGTILIAPKHIVPFEGGKGGDAHRAWERVFLWQHDRRWSQTERDIIGRTAENTIRLATVRAISRCPSSPSVSVEDVQWGWAIVHKSVSIIDEGVRNMTESDPEALRKAIVDALRGARNGELYRSRLMKRSGVKKASMNEYQAAMAWLYASGEVVDISAEGDGSKIRLVSHEA